MDASQLESLTVPQLVSLLLALVCELTRRLNTPIEVAATIGDAVDDNSADNAGMPVDGSTSNPAASSTDHPWRVPAPGTPSGPLPADQCHFLCGIADCDNFCAAIPLLTASIDANITGGTEPCLQLHICMLDFFINSLSEFTCSIPKQFSGDCPVLGVHTGFSADRLGDSGIPKECQIVTERSESASEATIKSLWLQLDGRVDFDLSWNKGVWKLIFDHFLNPPILSGRKFLRIAFAACPNVTTEDVEMPIEKCRLSSFATHWKRLATNADEVCLAEVCEDNLDNILKRWSDALPPFFSWALEQRVKLFCWRSPRPDGGSEDILASKGPLNLIERAYLLQRKINSWVS